MKRDLDRWSLVIAGRWNTAILSPDWLATEVFKQQELRIMYPVLGWAPPVFEAADIKVMVSPDRVLFVPLHDNEDLLARIEAAARHVLGTLPHTPISAFGENFHYTVEGAPKALADVLGFHDADRLEKQGKISEISLRRTLDLGKHRLNLTITSGNPSRIELNYHYDVVKALDAAEAMENTYQKNRDHGLEVLRAVYDLTLDEDEANDEKPE
jgi:hypothetical protein